MRLEALVAEADAVAGTVARRRRPGDAPLSIEHARDPAAVEVGAITLDSTEVAPGTLFCCVPGHAHDGHDFAAASVARGAVALLCQRHLELGVPEVVVPDARAWVGPLAAALNGRPSEAMCVVGVTGTNGKTTTTHLLQSIFTAAGQQAATIGTLSGTRTTPEAPVLQAKLAALRASGTTAVAMEVSSHALALRRADGVAFAAAVFTNLSQDHLDFHHTMESYFEAKARLFEPGRAAIAVVNADDPWGARLLQRIEAEAGTTGRPQLHPFSLQDLEGLTIERDGSRFTWRGRAVHLRLGGRFNAANALAAATTAHLLGIDTDAVVAGLEALGAVRGRFEQVEAGQPFTVLVDYAHTPDGLAAALASARELAGPGRVIVAFGAGGDRDRTKRPAMGEVAAGAADVVVLTSDNPRSEDPAAIIEQVRAGAKGKAQVEVEVDRRRAIGRAVAAARRGDVVLVAGKGHETVQYAGSAEVAFDDVEVSRGELDALRDRRGGW